MGIDQTKYWSPATKQDAGTVTIQSSVAFHIILKAIRSLQSGQPVNEDDLKRLGDIAAQLETHWDALSGWAPDADG